LTGLEDLYLDNNEIASLPSEIGLMTGLQSLYLGGNYFISSYLNETEELCNEPYVFCNDYNPYVVDSTE